VKGKAVAIPGRPSPIVLTIGHSTRTLEEFVGLLLHPESTGLADEGELGFMKSVEAQFEKIVVAKAKGAGEQTANLAIDAFHLSAGQTGVVKAQDSLGLAEEGFCHGLELADSAGSGFCSPFAQEDPGSTPIVLLPKFAQFLFEQVGALERLIDFQASLQSPGSVLFHMPGSQT
jgi:hypothetical protein